MKTELEIAKEMIIAYLSKDPNIYGVREILEISSGNKEVLLAHIDALLGIFQGAKDQLKGGDE